MQVRDVVALRQKLEGHSEEASLMSKLVTLIHPPVIFQHVFFMSQYTLIIEPVKESIQ